MRWRRESRLALGLALAAVSLAGASLTASGATSGGGAPELRRQESRLGARAHAALLDLYALDSRLTQARQELARVRNRLHALRLEQRAVRQTFAVVTDNLRSSQRLLGARLRALYEEGEPDAIAVLLGASSLDDALTRLNELEQSAREGAQAVTDTRNGRARLQRLAAALAAQVRELRALAARAEQTTATLTSARAERVAYLAALRRRQRLTRHEIARLESEARAVVGQAEVVQTRTAETTQTQPPPVVAGARTLTVTATGYSLPGRTSTGLPVGPGVVAVDPSVIPLGTRLTIPGYGEGVAADTGSAVAGYTIDLWFPTPADALAWGRRTVTITLH